MITLRGADARQIVVLSGKGGTGKTSVTAAFAHLASQGARTRPVIVDADVDASNLALVLAPEPAEEHEFIGGQVAVIDPSRCGECGMCLDVCRFDAIRYENGYVVDPVACEGCATCQTQCRWGAIRMQPERAGRWLRSGTRFGPLFHADLLPGAENSGKLVTLVRQQAADFAADEHRPLVLVDGPPGIGCPVIAAVTGADLAVLVTEPTVSGVQDLQRVLETTQHFGIPAAVCINKADIYPAGRQAIEDACRENNLPVIAHIPFDTAVVEAMVHAQPITVFAPGSPVSEALEQAWKGVLSIL